MLNYNITFTDGLNPYFIYHYDKFQKEKEILLKKSKQKAIEMAKDLKKVSGIVINMDFESLALYLMKDKIPLIKMRMDKMKAKITKKDDLEIVWSI